jgi:hypothetical protein
MPAAAGGTTHLLFGDTVIPDAPHLIIATPNLLPLWEAEIKIWLGNHVECFIYKGGFRAHRQFFQDGGLFSMSKLPKYRRIILISTNVSNFHLCFIIFPYISHMEQDLVM